MTRADSSSLLHAQTSERKTKTVKHWLRQRRFFIGLGIGYVVKIIKKFSAQNSTIVFTTATVDV
jgi:hypothetical protein